ncbi:hypothetical protein [Kutzneria sp. CA-103260]|uniref:hypothetical protein n=1 Tax=Kutzneria sp. CA-103260 TaxID=2802641 RepID=UPI001BA7EB62|nr:hypothetical protein [Kutzneria sp. CA-103260]QUQ67693.1 hypothetical protein JJ691_54280 [Kutzneria sp. CA-103260]
MSWIRGVAAAAAVMMLGGCAGIAGQAEPQLGAQAGIQHPADRDNNAVLAGLRRLDACALFDGAQPVPLGPHACGFVLDPKSHATLKVAVGLDSPFSRRWTLNPISIGGAKAYWATGEAGCQLDIPVSFTSAVYLASDTKSCDPVKAAAATVVAKLGNPDAVAVPASRPLAGWDGCSLLDKALGGLDPKAKVQQDVVETPFDTCSVVDATPRTPKATLDMQYTSDPLSGLNRTPRQVGDKTANVDDLGSTCDVAWAVGPSGSDQSHNTAVVSVRLKGCDAATALAVKVQQALAGPTPSNDKPQRPLVYGANDPDTEAVGACVDFQSHDGSCRPYQPITLPRSFSQWFAAANTQTSIACAISVDAVHQVYGDAFKPVLSGDFCYYVEPTHALLLSFDVSTVYKPGDYGNRPDLYANVRTTTVSGKQAKTFTDSIKGAKPGQPTYHEYDVYVSPFNDLTRNGMIAAEAQATIPRGGGFGDPLDVSRLHDLDQVMAKIIAKYGP